MSALSQAPYEHAGRPIPPALADWEDRVTAWCDDYGDIFPGAELSEINLDFAVFVFDHTLERVTLAYAVCVEQLMKRDKSRMQGFPNPNVSARRVLGKKAFRADKGHFLGHASGGILDINLFPQRRELKKNRGWSAEGKEFRRMESYVAQHPGIFFYHRPIYDDDTWVLCRSARIWCAGSRDGVAGEHVREQVIHPVHGVASCREPSWLFRPEFGYSQAKMAPDSRFQSTRATRAQTLGISPLVRLVQLDDALERLVVITRNPQHWYHLRYARLASA